MTRNHIIGIALLLLLVLALVAKQCGKNAYNWSEWDERVSYREIQDEPYSFSALIKLAHLAFEGHFQQINTAKLTELSKYDPTQTTYVFVGAQPYYDSLEVSKLLQFVADGGQAFICAKLLSQRLEDSIYQTSLCGDEMLSYEDQNAYDYLDQDSVVYCELTNPALRTEYALYFKDKRVLYQWPRIKTAKLCEDLPFEILGNYGDGDANYMSIEYGKGHFLIHTLPLVFTNYHLLRSETRPYINSLFSDMQSEHVLWDLYAKSDEARRKAMAIPNAARSAHNNGILSTMLREPALAFAWFILLGMVGLFLIFRSKREQRLIPVLPPNKNTSLQFVNTLARLQFRQQNFQSICRQDMRFFLHAVRERTGISILMQTNGQVSYDNALLERISVGTGYPLAHLRDIFTRYEACAMFAPTGDMMADLHTSVEQFIHFKKTRR